MKYADNASTLRAKLWAQRCFYSLRIHEALRHNGRTATSLARELGVTLPAVSATIIGRRHTPRILDALKAAGVPEEYLFDPRITEIEKKNGGDKEKINQKLTQEAI